MDKRIQTIVTAGLWAAAAVLAVWTVFSYALAGPVQSVVLKALEPAAEASFPGLDLNSADLAELQELPGIGPVLAQRIMDYREENGPFASPEDVIAVSGIGPAVYEAIEPFIDTFS